MGDPTVSEASTGSAIFDAAVAGMVDFLETFRTLPPTGVRAHD